MRVREAPGEPAGRRAPALLVLVVLIAPHAEAVRSYGADLANDAR